MQHANDTTDDALTCHQVDMFNTLVYDHRSIRCLQTAAERLCRSGTFWRNKQPKSPQILEPFTDRRRAQRSLLTFRIKKWIYRHSCWSTRLQECVHRRGVVKFSSLTPDRRQDETVSLSNVSGWNIVGNIQDDIRTRLNRRSSGPDICLGH